MKKLFFALALTGIVGAASISTVSAITHSNMVVKGGGDEKKKKDKCSKEKTCCKSKTGETSSTEGEKKCCHSSAGATKTCTGKTTTSTAAETKTEVKKTEEQK